MKTIIIVRNTTTPETFVYDREDIVKARIAVDYLTTTTSQFWYLERVQVEAYASTNFLAGQNLTIF